MVLQKLLRAPRIMKRATDVMSIPSGVGGGITIVDAGAVVLSKDEGTGTIGFSGVVALAEILFFSIIFFKKNSF